jgi:hypothetical protein
VTFYGAKVCVCSTPVATVQHMRCIRSILIDVLSSNSTKLQVMVGELAYGLVPKGKVPKRVQTVCLYMTEKSYLAAEEHIEERMYQFPQRAVEKVDGTSVIQKFEQLKHPQNLSNSNYCDPISLVYMSSFSISAAFSPIA